MSASAFRNSTGPLGLRILPTPSPSKTGDTNLAPGDTAFAPLALGWNAGNFHWNVGVFGSPADRRLQHAAARQYQSRTIWPVTNRNSPAPYLNPQTGWQVNAAAIYVFNFEQNDGSYFGEILNLEGNVAKVGRWGLGVTAYAMIQTTPDPVSPATMTTWWSRMAAAMSSRRSLTGSSGG